MNITFRVLRAFYRKLFPIAIRQRLMPWLLAKAVPFGISWSKSKFLIRTSGAIKLDPATLLLLQMQRYQEAIQVAGQIMTENPSMAAYICKRILEEDPSIPQAYVVRAEAFRATGEDQQAANVAWAACDMGMKLVGDGELASAAQFFADVAPAFPDVCEPYALLYGQINVMTNAHRDMRDKPPASGARRRLVISISVWGERYTNLFTRYFLPSILSPNNIPALNRIREILFDLYTIPECVEMIRAAPSFQILRRYAKIRFVTFPDRILTSPEYQRTPGFRYYIYGGFHHVSIEHARTLGADIICIAPDGVHSDGSFYNYARYIDEGYKAVMFTATRGQAEKLLPILDQLRDETTQSLTLLPRTLVELVARHIHHEFQRYILTKNNRYVPSLLSIMLFPRPNGFFIRSFHLHPIIIAHEALQKDIPFDYTTVDDNLITHMFPDSTDWKNIKIIDDTDDGVMMDITYITPPHNQPEQTFTPNILIKQISNFRANHFWNFKHRIIYHCDATLDAIGTYDVQEDGSLVAKTLLVSSAIDMDDEKLEAWFEANKPKDLREEDRPDHLPLEIGQPSLTLR